MFVVKNNKEKEPYDAEKIHDKTLMAVDGLSNVSASEIEMNAGLSLRNNIPTEEIQDNLIMSAAELIDEDHPNYEIAAARLLNQKLRKQVYSQYSPLPFLDEVEKRVNKGYYDKLIFKKYTREEIAYFGSKIRYERDDKFTFTGLSQMFNVYLIKNNGRAIETPQEMFMLMNMYVFADYEKDERKKWVMHGYNALSRFEVSLPTPIMNGLRTTFKRFISCNLIDAGDTTQSLALANAFIMMMTANKSGLGLNTGAIRGLDADIGNGRIKHTGILPILKAYEKSTGAFTQIGRGGSSTNHYPFFHYEIDLIMELGNAKGTEDTRVRHADHSIVFNKLFFERLINKQDITLFHMNAVPGLYDAIGDNEKFKELYEGYEESVPKKHKRIITADDFAEQFINERFLQGRLYYVFADNAHKQGPWNIPVYISNLCQEILVPIKPLDQEDAEVGVCILAGINHGHVSDERIPVVSEWAVRFLDAMIDYMDYSHEEVELPAKLRRTLGIGHSDIFHFMAKNKEFYNTQSGRNLLHDRIELASYHMHRASIELAKELGACAKIDDTKYASGWFPIDSYNKRIDELVGEEQIALKQDWEALRIEQKKYGQRHSTLTANAPFGNSAKPSNSTSGIEPPRFLATEKEDKNIITQLVPEYSKYKNYYTTAWGDDFNNIDYFKFVAIVQKFTDQSMSTNQYTNLLKYPDSKVPFDVLMEEFLTAYKYGLKTMYYQNFRTSDDEDGISEEEPQGCESGGCSV